MNIVKNQIADQFRHFYWKITDELKSRPINESGVIIATALIVGAGAGLGAVGFKF